MKIVFYRSAPHRAFTTRAHGVEFSDLSDFVKHQGTGIGQVAS